MSLVDGVPVTSEATVASAAQHVDLLDELAELRLRVAAQDRLIEAMLEENESIHVIRRHYESRRWYHLLDGTLLYRIAVGIRNRLRAVARRLSVLARRFAAGAQVQR